MKQLSNFFLPGNKFLPEMHLIEAEPEEYKNLKKLEIYDIFIKTNQIKPDFNMTWLMEISKV